VKEREIAIEKGCDTQDILRAERGPSLLCKGGRSTPGGRSQTSEATPLPTEIAKKKEPAPWGRAVIVPNNERNIKEGEKSLGIC